MPKSYVSLEQRKCVVCARDFDTNTVLFDQRLRERFDTKTVTGWGMCPEHQTKYDEGYIALVGADESKSTKRPGQRISPDGAYRTGEIVHVRFALFERVFNVPIKDAAGRYHEVMFCDAEVIAHLQKMAEGAPDA
jgi:hypothetical protein